MNKNSIYLGVAFLVIVLAGILIYPFVKRASFQVSAEALVIAPKPPAPAHEIPSVVVKNMDDAETKREKSLTELSLPKPTTIYAKIVDQSGKPISGAKAVVVSALATSGAKQKVEQTSDSDGTLSFSTTWRMLSVTVTKPGYHDLIASSATFQYAKSAVTPPPKPDSGNPVLFVLQR